MIVNSKPILTIAIPTFNRKVWLEQSLGRIIEQVEAEEPGLIEVIVSDNASNDGSFEWLLEKATSHPALRVFCNSQNLGAEGNIRGLPAISSGRYLWLLGDDDYLEPGALSKFISLLHKNYDYIVLNFSALDEYHYGKKKPYWDLKSDTEVSSSSECSSYVPHFAFAFISCWIAKKELFNLTTFSDYDRFRKFGLSLLIDRYLTVFKGYRGIVLAKSFLNTRRAPANEYPPTFDYFGWFFGGSAEAYKYLNSIGILSDREIRAKKIWLLHRIALKRIIYERAIGVFNRKNVVRILIKDYSALWQFWVICIPAIFIPGLGMLAKYLFKIR